MTGDTAPNQYKQAVDGARSASAPVVARLREALDAATRAMAAGAWQSTKATEFDHGLTANVRTLRLAGDRVEDEFSAKVGSEPEHVDENDWRATWFRRARINAGMR